MTAWSRSQLRAAAINTHFSMTLLQYALKSPINNICPSFFHHYVGAMVAMVLVDASTFLTRLEFRYVRPQLLTVSVQGGMRCSNNTLLCEVNMSFIILLNAMECFHVQWTSLPFKSLFAANYRLQWNSSKLGRCDKQEVIFGFYVIVMQRTWIRHKILPSLLNTRKSLFD